MPLWIFTVRSIPKPATAPFFIENNVQLFNLFKFAICHFLYYVSSCQTATLSATFFPLADLSVNSGFFGFDNIPINSERIFENKIIELEYAFSQMKVSNAA